MKQSAVFVKVEGSGLPKFGNIIISVKDITNGICNVLIGYPGLPNVNRKMSIGQTVLFETPMDGVLEVRVFGIGRGMDYGINSFGAEFLVTQVSPRMGIAAGFVGEDPNNSSFSAIELGQIAESIRGVKLDLSQRSDIVPEQLDLIVRRLDEIQSASERLGRKDWINYVAGTLTSLCISAAFSPEVTKTLFQSVNSAFFWLFNNAPLLLISLK
jgi:hypothetical protein